MKLAASLILRNELGRYLESCIAHLLEFADEIIILDNGSTDGWEEALRPTWGKDGHRVIVNHDPNADREEGSLFVSHARSRQLLLDLTVARQPTWIAALDSDEFVADGAQLRHACETEQTDTLALCLEEVWNADPDRLELRQDGGWVEHDVAMVWRPDRIQTPHQIIDRGPATGRTPENLVHAYHGHSCTALLHFGWVNKAERADRHHRYAVADGGHFHASQHLASILWPDIQISLLPVGWPAGLDPYRDRILERAA